MHRHGGLRRHGHGRQSQRFDRRSHRRGIAADDERSGREGDAALLELLLDRLDLQLLEPVAQRDHVDSSRSARRRTSSPRRRRCRRDVACCTGVSAEVEHRLVGDLLHLHVAHQPHRPRGIVVGAGDRVGIDLLLEQRLGEAAVRLIALDDVRAGREGAFLQLVTPRSRVPTSMPCMRSRLTSAGDPRHVALPRRDHVAGDRVRPAGIQPRCATSGRSSPE